MPSMDAPAYYDRAKWTAAGRADDFLKWISPDYYEADTGSVEEPIGWVGLIKIDRTLIAEYVSTFGDPWMSEALNFEPGWYIVRQDDNGLVWGLGYGGWCNQHDAICYDTHAESSARADFEEAEQVSAHWHAMVEEGENYNA